MENTRRKAILSLLGYMYFADISIVNSGVSEAYAQVYHLVIFMHGIKGLQCKCIAIATILKYNIYHSPLIKLAITSQISEADGRRPGSLLTQSITSCLSDVSLILFIKYS